MTREMYNQAKGSKGPSGRRVKYPAGTRMGDGKTRGGFTVFELLIAVAIMMILASMAALAFSAYRETAMVARAISDIHTIQNSITSFQIVEDRLPADLAEVHWDAHYDPWGHAYQYTNLQTEPKGKWRKDKFLVPINSSYDLWSMGPDGKSVAPLTAKFSQDDIIRANDGLFIGRATSY